ncbi:hypothetical protein Tsp_13711 [Trichinella spiralis]|uniref:hypothetical protein n=1 Tax=Trichinella spiralis TaxID=6334 RepID=UPI0001EFD63E|nr:hypothetical protein Tsp_13711 [Trichinella spiralis]
MGTRQKMVRRENFRIIRIIRVILSTHPRSSFRDEIPLNTMGSLPLRAIKRLKACRSRGAVISDTTSRCTARVDIQGRVTLVRSEGSGAIFATNGLDSIRLQLEQACITFFTSRLPFKIQYRCLSVARVNSHPPCVLQFLIVHLHLGMDQIAVIYYSQQFAFPSCTSNGVTHPTRRSGLGIRQFFPNRLRNAVIRNKRSKCSYRSGFNLIFSTNSTSTCIDRLSSVTQDSASYSSGLAESISFGQLFSSVSQVGPFHHNESDRSRFIVEPRLRISAGFDNLAVRPASQSVDPNF